MPDMPLAEQPGCLPASQEPKCRPRAHNPPPPGTSLSLLGSEQTTGRDRCALTHLTLEQISWRLVAMAFAGVSHRNT